jgi:RHS repeat-associated protein
MKALHSLQSIALRALLLIVTAAAPFAVLAGPTTTTLSATPSPAYVGQSVALRATVTGTSPTGTVTFKDGTTSLGTATLSSGVATLNKSFTATGNRSLTATYGGNAGNSASTSPVVVLTVNPKTNTTTSLATNPRPSFVGQAVTMTATVTGSSPTGTVTFKNGTTTLGTATLSGGVATRVQTFTAAGTANLTAVYGGNAANNTSTSTVVSQTVNAKATTTTSLAASPNPTYANQPVTLTATISSSTATGTVTFKDGTSTLGTAVAAGGVATLSKSFTATGTRNLTAVYAGDAGHLTSTSAVTALVVNAQSNTTTTLSSSNSNPSVGQTFDLLADVSGPNPTGIVTFKEGATVLGTAAVVENMATLPVSFTVAGSHTLVATYAGDAAHKSSTSTSYSQFVSGMASQTALSTAGTDAMIGTPFALTATVTGFNPTGTVSFEDQSGVLGSASLTGGVASLNVMFTAAGVRQVVARYGGDGQNQASSSPTVYVNALPKASSVALVASPRSVVSGQPTSLIATVTGASPSGSVSFYEGGTLLGTASVVSGQATLNGVLSPAGVHSIHAIYSGDAANAGSRSTAIQMAVGAGTVPVSPGNMTWQYGYNPDGNLTTIVDPNGNQSSFGYDALQRRAAVAQPQPAPGLPQPLTTTSFDGQGRPIAVQDPRGLATVSTLDGIGNLWAYTSPDAGASTATYDAAGNLLTRTDARGKTTTYAHDDLGRPTSISYASGTATVFEYDGGATPAPYSKGRLTKITDESGTTSYTYDARGRVLTKTQVVGSGGGAKTFSVVYTWGTTGTATGKLISILYPSGTRVNYGYDTAGRVSSISLNPVNANGVGTSGTEIPVLSGVSYSGTNSLLGWTWAGGVAYQRTYDSFGRLKSYPLGNPSGVGIAAGLVRTLSYDSAGRIIGYTHTNASGPQAAFDQTFAYDGVDRLIQGSQGGTSVGYGYDDTGNRTTLSTGSASYANVVDSTSNRLASVQRAGTSGTVTDAYQHDAAGNLTSDGSATYTYSDRGRLASATTGAGTEQYRYNGLEQRVSKTGASVPSGAAYYVYDESGKLIGEYDTNRAPLYETVHLADEPVAVLKHNGSTSNSTLAVVISVVYADHLGTPRVVSRSLDHAVQWRWDTAEAFGASPVNDNPSGLGAFVFNQRFPGQIYDASTANLQNWHRDYGPSIGRYVQSDPIGLQGGINTYTYVENQPTMKVDPKGLNPEEWTGQPPPNRPDGNPLGWGCGTASNDGLVPDGFRSADFVPSCRKHDQCYETCGNSKQKCDNDFLKDLLAACSRSGNQAGCRWAARRYYGAMQTDTSRKAYEAAQKEAGCCK